MKIIQCSVDDCVFFLQVFIFCQYFSYMTALGVKCFCLKILWLFDLYKFLLHTFYPSRKVVYSLLYYVQLFHPFLDTFNWWCHPSKGSHNIIQDQLLLFCCNAASWLFRFILLLWFCGSTTSFLLNNGYYWICIGVKVKFNYFHSFRSDNWVDWFGFRIHVCVRHLGIRRREYKLSVFEANFGEKNGSLVVRGVIGDVCD